MNKGASWAPFNIFYIPTFCLFSAVFIIWISAVIFIAFVYSDAVLKNKIANDNAVTFSAHPGFYFIFFILLLQTHSKFTPIRIRLVLKSYYADVVLFIRGPFTSSENIIRAIVGNTSRVIRIISPVK